MITKNQAPRQMGSLSFEEQVLTAHDWVEKTQEPLPSQIVQDDYDDGVQKLYITYTDGTRAFQRRRWGTSEDHDAYYKMREELPESEKNGPAVMEFIEQNSELLEEEELPPNYDEAEDSSVRTVSKVELEEIHLLSMELRHSLMTDFAKGLGDFTSLSEKFRLFMRNRQMRKELDFDFNAFDRFVAKASTRNHAELLDLRFFTPPGMAATYPQLLKVLEDCQTYSEKTLNETILPLKSWIASIYNEPERLKSVRTNVPVLVIDPTRLSKQLGAACSFSGPGQRPYGDCFERAEDLRETSKLLREIGSRYSSTTIERFDREVKELSSSFGLLAQRLSVMDDSKVSIEVANALSDYIHRVARQVEFYAVYNTVMRATLSALTQAREHWERQILR